MPSSDKQKIMLLSVVIIVVLSFALASYIANGQDEVYELEQSTYAQAVELYNNEQYNEALKLTSKLVTRKDNSEILFYLHALILHELKEYALAKIYFERTLEVNPHYVENPEFMIDFAVTLKDGGFKKDALLVLERCQTLEVEDEEYPEYYEIVEELTKQLHAAEG